MKITKKFLSILLATILILSVFPVTLAQASDSAITFSVETDAKNVKVGDTISVSVNMSEYNNLGALTLYVNYDSTALEIVNVQTNNAFGYEEFNTDYGSGKLAYLIASLDTKTVSGTLFTIQFEVLKEGCTEVSLTVDELTDIDLNKLSSSTQSAKVHKFDDGTVTPPTCVDKGYTTYACTCGHSYQADETDAKGHNFVNGTCTECSEKSIKWKFDEETGTLTIYGTGPMENCYDGGHPWESFKDDIKTVVIEYGVTSIRGYAFYGCTSLTSITIPDSVITIGAGAFQDCDNLTSVTIPDSVTSIESRAFYDCTSLESVSIGDGVTTIAQYAFTGCDSLTKIIVDSDNQYYSSDEYGVLFNKDKTILVQYPIGNTRTSYTIPDSVKTIADYAFFECATLTSVTFPDGITSIGIKSSFQDCSNITSITIPDSVTTIGTFVFLGCDSLASVTIPDSVTSIEPGAFDSCRSLTDVYYSSTEEKWNDISIATNNESLLNARIHYNNCKGYKPLITPPTCTEQGYTTYVCACGYSNGVVDNYVDATGHKYESEITIPATHLADGLMTYTCHCGDSYTEAIEKISEHNHNAVVTPPTCTEQGFTTYTCECGDTYIGDYVNANGHSYNPVVTPPTCTEGGYTTYTCTVCDDSYIDDETSATGHSYTSEITKPATHTENGEMTFTCACGDTYTESIDATGDHYHVPSVTAPTCTEGGYTTYTCVCGDTYVSDETLATGHDYDYENVVLIRPTETRKGCYMYICVNDTEHIMYEEVESADYTEYDKAIEKLNEYLADSNLTDEAKEFIVSGCVEIIQNNDEFYEDGIRERRNLIASEQHIIDKVTNELNEHFEVVDNFIANCESGNHDVKEYVSDNNATCTVNGTKRGACYYCGAEVVVDDENNPASGHDIVVDNAVAPDCVNTGLTEGSHCSRCDGATTEQEVVPALGHSYNSVVTSPTCTEGGYTTYTCACGDSYVDDETSAIGHSFSNGNCTVCGDADPDYYVFSVKSPSKTKIRNKDGIILHTEIDGNAPTGSYVKWTASNGNFDKTVMNNGSSLRVIANNNGYTTFTATLYDAEGNELAKDTVELYSQSGFFDKIGGFFRSFFGTTKIYEN